MSTHLPVKPSRAEFGELAKRGNLVPVYTELVADSETPVSAFQKISRHNYAFLLESAEKRDSLGRWSFLGAQPTVLVESTGNRVKITDHGETREFESADPLDELRKVMSRYRPVPLDSEAPFMGGAVGFCGYDLVRTFESTVPAPPPDQLELPDMLYMISDTLLIFDHRYRRITLVAHAFTEDEDLDAAYNGALQKLERIYEQLQSDQPLAPINLMRESQPVEIHSNTSREEYMAMVRASKEYVKAGDVFQVVGSQRFETDFTQEPLELYRHLRYINPSPYMFCLNFPGRFSLVGSSPELHVRSVGGVVSIRPIAGTRPRGRDEAEDKRLEEELLADPKECAEHIMLVDLARNDVGRISEYGSVVVDELMSVELYSHVMHIVSNVHGKLRKDKDAYDVLRATFPAGTVSGSPKVRAMQIINELEKSKRCAYAGAVGYFAFDGNHDSCITLRSVVLKDQKAYVQAGAGLVADSVPETEHQECVNKAMALMKAIEACKAAATTGDDEARPKNSSAT